jgi:putative thioredoxin
MALTTQGNSGKGPASKFVKDSSTHNFLADVIEASREAPVIVDFWAPWCGPCKQLGPALEKIVTEAKGAVRMVKINVDENQALAGQMGVQSIPAVFAFVDGQPVDGFLGALPESQLRAFVGKLVAKAPSPAAADLEAANAALAAGELVIAAEGFIEVLHEDEKNIDAIAGLASVYVEMKEYEQARGALAMAPADKADDPRLKAVRARLDLVAKAADLDDIGALSAKLEANPNDHQARFDLALALNIAGDREDAIQHLVEIVRRAPQWQDGAARLQLLQLFEAWGPVDPMTALGRRRLSAVLFA